MCPQDTMPHSMLMKLKSGSKPSWAYILKVYIIIYVYDLPKTLLLTTIKQNLTYYGTDRKTDTRTRKHNALQPSQTGHKNNCIELTIPRDIGDTFMSLDNLLFVIVHVLCFKCDFIVGVVLYSFLYNSCSFFASRWKQLV